MVLRYFADMSVADAAAVMGCAEGHGPLTHKGLTALRGQLDFQEEDSHA